MMSNTRPEFDVFKVGLNGHYLIEASAGTGKTWSTTALYLRLIVEHALLPRNILVVTFTRAATAELAGRIRDRLQGMLTYLQTDAASKDDGFYKRLRSDWTMAGYSPSQVQRALRNALSQFDEAAIFTIHSFCQQVLKDYAFESGTRFDLEAETDDSLWRQQIAEDYWRRAMGDLHESDNLDRAWVEWLLKKQQTPYSLLASVYGHVGKSAYVEIQTPEAVAAERDYAAKEAAAVAAYVADAVGIVAQWESAFSTALNGNKYRKYRLPTFLDALAAIAATRKLSWTRELKELRSAYFKEQDDEGKYLCINKGKANQAPDHPFFTLLSDAYDAYQQQELAFAIRLRRMRADLLETLNRELPLLKRQQRVMGFNDMLGNLHQALRGPSAEGLAEAVSSRFRAAMIDEFQDTDPLQLDVFTRLFRRDNISLFYVGDPKQAIYGFRGGDIHAYYKAAKQTPRHLTLMTNYRSTPALVGGVSQLFSGHDVPFVTSEIVYDEVEAVNANRLQIEGDDEGALNLCLLPEEAVDSPKGLSKGAAREAAFAHVAAKISELLSMSARGKASIVENGQRRPLVPADFAVLVSSHYEAGQVKDCLANLGIPSVRKVQQKVLSSDAASTLLRLMQAVAEPANEARLTEFLADPLLGNEARQIVDWRADDDTWEGLIQMLWVWRELWMEQGFSALFQRWLMSETAAVSIPQHLLAYAEGERHLTDLLHLSEVLQEQARHHHGIQSLVSWLSRAMSSGVDNDEWRLRLESDTDRVKISTVHNSKGLQYNVVFCPMLWTARKHDDDAPAAASAYVDEQAVVDFGTDHYDDILQRQHVESFMEELRKAYVALTRPVFRCYVFLPHAPKELGHSPLGWLLFGSQEMADAPTTGLKRKLGDMDFGSLEGSIKTFVKAARKRIPHGGLRLVEATIHGLPWQGSMTGRCSLKAAALPERNLAPSWWQSSFSALTRDQHVQLEWLPSERSDDLASPDTVPPEWVGVTDTAPSMFNFPRGAVPGECLHAIFEDWDFQCKDQAKLNELLASKLDAFAIDDPENRARWIPVLSEMVQRTLGTPLAETLPPLGSMSSRHRLAEMEFLLTAEGRLSELAAVLARPEHALPEVFIRAAAQLENHQLKGFLTGFIDLVFMDDTGRFHVLDWKSNHLGYLASDYDRDRLERAMASSHYYLQALLYLVALHRHLQVALVDYEPQQHLGSGWYVFLRGVTGQTGAGAYELRITPDLVMALDRALGRAV